jgi:nitronate monooxygenase
VLRNESAEAVVELDRQGITDFERFRPHVMGHLAHNAYVTGDARLGMIDYGHAAIFADEVASVATIIDAIIDDAAAATRRLQSVTTSTARADAAAVDTVPS